MSSNVKRFILLGDSGAGKSSFVNIFYNYCYGTRNPDDVFGEDQQSVQLAIPCKNWLDRIQDNEKSSERDINDQTRSQTMDCTSYKLRFDSVTIELIDTPGFNDSDGVCNDETALRQIEQILQNIPFLSGIIVVANGSTARLGTSFLHFMRLLHEVCPNSVMQNMCAVLTNCDDISCTLSLQILHTELKVNETTTFYLQNSLFHWDRAIRTSKIIRNLRRDFEDAMITLKKLFLTLVRFDNVSTDAFRVGELKRRRIQKCIVTSIQKIINLLKVNRLQRVVADGLSGAKTTMAANTNWEKQETITAFKWMEVEPSRPRQRSLSNNGSSSSSTFHTENSAKTSLPGERDTTRFCVSENMECDTLPTKIKYDERDSLSYSRNSTRDTMPTVHSHAYSGMRGKSSLASVESTAHQPMRSLESHNSARESNYYSHLKPSSKSSAAQYDDNDHQHQAEPRCPRKYQRQDLKLQVTLHDNEAKSHHETARHQAKFLQDKAIQFSNKHQELVSSMNSLLDELEDNVRDMREINPDIDLVERNKDFIQELRDEINLGGNEPKMIAFFDEIVRIVSKPKARLC
jgi:hypothetical protein